MYEIWTGVREIDEEGGWGLKVLPNFLIMSTIQEKILEENKIT